MKRPCLPLPAASTKILYEVTMNIAQPRMFCPPKIIGYTVYSTNIKEYIAIGRQIGKMLLSTLLSAQ